MSPHLLRAPPSASARAATSRTAGSSLTDSTDFAWRRACDAAVAAAAPSLIDAACKDKKSGHLSEHGFALQSLPGACALTPAAIAAWQWLWLVTCVVRRTLSVNVDGLQGCKPSVTYLRDLQLGSHQPGQRRRERAANVRPVAAATIGVAAVLLRLLQVPLRCLAVPCGRAGVPDVQVLCVRLGTSSTGRHREGTRRRTAQMQQCYTHSAAASNTWSSTVWLHELIGG